MPEKNIVDIYMDVLKNNDRYLFDWEADAGATSGSMFAMGTAANMVQIFNGVLDWDGASWCQLINSFSMDSSSYDAKYSESFAKMFCTYSDEELSQDVDAMKEKLKPFDGGEWISDSMKDIDDLYDDKIGDLSRATADLKKKVVAENKASMIAFNKSYQELDELCSKTDTFNHLTNVLDDFYSIVEIAGYASEFQNQDKFAVKSLDTFIKNSNYGSVMSTAMKDGLSDYKNILETDIVTYSAYNYLMNNMGDMLKDAIDISTVLLDTESKIYLLIWDISKGTVPWVKNGLSNTDCFLQSMYAGIVQSDTFKSYIDKRDAVFKDANNITSKNLYEVTQYCYAYLKSCYITRDAAVGALTEKTKEDNPTYESTQKMVNQEIAKCLVKLKDADKTNKYGCYGFLPENNKQYLSEYDDGELLKCVVSSVDGEEIMLVKCMFSGSGGQGSALMAKLVCEGAMRENLKVVMTQTYGIEQRGGDSTAFIIISDEAIGSPIVENDATIAVALSQSIYEQCLHGVAPGGMLFTNASLVENPGTAEGFTQILLPVSEIAVEVGSVRSVNMVMLGAVIAKTKLLKRETIMAVLEETMGRKKPELLEFNIKAFNAGYEAVGKGE